MAGKFHLNPDTGVIGRCHAEVEPCPFGEANHFDDPREGRKLFEKQNQDSNLLTMRKNITTPQNAQNGLSRPNNKQNNQGNHPVVKPVQTALSVEKGEVKVEEIYDRINPDAAPVGMRELNNYAKKSADPETLMEAANRGSERVLSSLAKNPAATPEALRAAAGRVEAGGEVHREILKAVNYPVSEMASEEYPMSLNSSNLKARLSSPDVTDAQLDALMKTERIPGVLQYSKAEAIDQIVQTENKVSAEKITEILNREKPSSSTVLKARDSGRYNIADNVEHLSENTRYNIVSRAEKNIAVSSAELEAIAVHAAKENTTVNNAILLDAASKRNATTKTIDLAVENMTKNPPESVNITKMMNVYQNPNTSTATREKMERYLPVLRAQSKLRDIETATGSPVKNQIITSTNTQKSGRAYTTTTVHLDLKRIKELGLTEDDVRAALGAEGYNAQNRLDLERGVFVGGVDSSD